MNVKTSLVKPLRRRQNWNRGFVTVGINYPPAIQIESFNVYWGFGRPVNRVRLKRVLYRACVIDIATGFKIPDCDLMFFMNTVDPYDTYNPLQQVRLLNGGISAKYDNWILLNDSGTDLDIDMDVFVDSSPNFFYIRTYAFLPVSYVGKEIDAFFTIIFDYQ